MTSHGNRPAPQGAPASPTRSTGQPHKEHQQHTAKCVPGFSASARGHWSSSRTASQAAPRLSPPPRAAGCGCAPPVMGGSGRRPTLPAHPTQSEHRQGMPIHKNNVNIFKKNKSKKRPPAGLTTTVVKSTPQHTSGRHPVKAINVEYCPTTKPSSRAGIPHNSSTSRPCGG